MLEPKSDFIAVQQGNIEVQHMDKAKIKEFHK